MPLSGKVAVVTGAGSGVGRAIAEALGGEGAAVALLGRRVERLQETERAIRDAGGEARSFAADVTDEGSVRAARDAIGPVDILVNNAGIHGGFASITTSDPMSWWRTMTTNLYGPYLLCRLYAPEMRERGWGRLIQVSSAAGLGGVGSQSSDYCLSKYALNFFTRQLASELDGGEVSCCAIHPGEVKSEMWAAIRADALARGGEGKGALGWVEMVERTGGDPPAKAAELVVKIVHAPAAETNGKFLWIDGGITTPWETW